MIWLFLSLMFSFFMIFLTLVHQFIRIKFFDRRFQLSEVILFGLISFIPIAGHFAFIGIFMITLCEEYGYIVEDFVTKVIKGKK